MRHGLPGCGLIAEHRGEPCGGGRVFYALGQALFDARAACVLGAGGADGVAFLAGQSPGCSVVIVCLSRLASPPFRR